MFNKLLFNNELIANKKNVQKAKTMCINKLVQKIRKLKSKVEKKPENENKKILIKIANTTETIHCLRKMKDIKILKNALLYKKNSNSVLTNGLSLPEEIAEALLFSHKIMTEAVKDIKKKCELNSNNPGWKEKIQELSKKEQKDKHKEHIKEKIKNRIAQKELKRKREEWLEENVVKDDKPILMDNENHGAWVENPVGDIDLTVEKIVPMSALYEYELSNFKQLKKLKIEKQIKKKKDTNKSKSTIEEDVLNEENIVETEPHLQPVKTIDSFFLTNDGDNYLSTGYVNRTQPERPDDGMIRKERREIQKKNRSNVKPHKVNKNFKMHSMENDKSANTKDKSAKRNEKSVKKNEKFPNNKNTSKNNQTNLENPIHPSWVAKQKQKGIEEFSGKKIVFDDDTKPKKLVNQKSLEKTTEAKITEKLHPSWEAKQKLKPAISEFTGKKTTFNFDDE